MFSERSEARTFSTLSLEMKHDSIFIKKKFNIMGSFSIFYSLFFISSEGVRFCFQNYFSASWLRRLADRNFEQSPYKATALSGAVCQQQC
jgi:hypothetical protein